MPCCSPVKRNEIEKAGESRLPSGKRGEGDVERSLESRELAAGKALGKAGDADVVRGAPRRALLCYAQKRRAESRRVAHGRSNHDAVVIIDEPHRGVSFRVLRGANKHVRAAHIV